MLVRNKGFVGIPAENGRQGRGGNGEGAHNGEQGGKAEGDGDAQVGGSAAVDGLQMTETGLLLSSSWRRL
jgi:hypothetical protein